MVDDGLADRGAVGVMEVVRPSSVGLRGQALNHPQVHWLKTVVLSVVGEVAARSRQVWVGEMRCAIERQDRARTWKVGVALRRCCADDGGAGPFGASGPPQSLCREGLQTTRKVRRSRAGVLSVAGEVAPLSAAGVTQEGERE